MMVSLLALLALAQQADRVEVERIWDQAPHCAFTDLLRHRERWICVFREGKGHVSPDGAIRVLSSKDGKEWRSIARLTSPTADLRDPKVTTMPDGRLLLNAAAAPHPPSPIRRQSLTWISEDGVTWKGPHKVGDPNFWLWRVTWHKGIAYGIGYGVGDKRLIRLYHSRDGVAFETLAASIFDRGYPNETSLVFLEDGSCLCLLRRDGKAPTAQLGRSEPPYVKWTWKDLGVRLGGPRMIRLPDGRLLAAGRRYEGGTRTVLHWLDADKGRLKEFQRLPSGGDTSYPGLVLHAGLLWVSYYSSHEGKARIYLAKVRLP